MEGLLCPVCRRALTDGGRVLSCEAGHAFDKAKEGYVNLLTGHKNGDFVGDNKEMAKARHAFLESGAYSLLKEGLQSTLTSFLPQGGCLCDAGCGDGFYTSSLPASFAVYGFDISKNMLRYAAKRRESAVVFAAGVNDIPVSDGMFDAVLSVFAPFCDREFARVLKKDGLLFSVGAGKRHLWGLKEVLYASPYENDEALLPAESFVLLEERRFGNRVTLTGSEQIASLLSMTPYAYRTPRDGKERLAALESLTTELDFLLRIYRKK